MTADMMHLINVCIIFCVAVVITVLVFNQLTVLTLHQLWSIWTKKCNCNVQGAYKTLKVVFQDLLLCAFSMNFQVHFLSIIYDFPGLFNGVVIEQVILS